MLTKKARHYKAVYYYNIPCTRILEFEAESKQEAQDIAMVKWQDLKEKLGNDDMNLTKVVLK